MPTTFKLKEGTTQKREAPKNTTPRFERPSTPEMKWWLGHKKYILKKT